MALWIAIHLPRRIRYWATMQIIGEALGDQMHYTSGMAIPIGDLFRKIEPPTRPIQETMHNLEGLNARSERSKR